jgi:hypothetical protein
MYRRALTLSVIASLWTAPVAAYPTEFRSEAEARGHLPQEPPLPPVPPRPAELHAPQTTPIVRRLRPGSDGPRVAAGALSGKSVYLSPGHGWYYSSGWHTQRGNVLGVVEDLSNADGVDEFLVPYLLNAGALVVPVREIDPTTQMVILDDSDGIQSPARGRYVETGSGAAFIASTTKGWGHPPTTITGTTNPFLLGTDRLLKAAPIETARATFALAVPQAGFYNVYLAYAMSSTRASDAHVIVVHPGGRTELLVDQRRMGGTWLLLGRFYFDAGTDDKRGAIVVTNESQDVGSTISVDAVRIGGGLGLLDRGGGASKQARADECCRYHAQFVGAPSTVYDASTGVDNTDDVSCRSRLAQWLHAVGEPAVFVSHHSNAFDGTDRGTESYIYGPNAPDGSYQPTAAALALGSDKLAKAVHDQVVADLRGGFEPGWTDRKLKSAYFGEINPAYQNEMPSMLIEIAFHDEKTDIAALKEARFRRLVARAITKGIVKYFAAKDGTVAVFSPEPPTAVVARGTGAGDVTVSWSPPPTGGPLGSPATSYRVYRGGHGYAFDEGSDTRGQTSLTLTGLAPGQIVYLRVTATNDGGESLPSPTLAVSPSATGHAPLLLVAGFERFDAAMNLKPVYPIVGATDRLFIDRINNGTYLVQHATAVAPTTYAFDSCTHDAVGGAVSLAAYRLVLWQGGKGVTPDAALSANARQTLEQAHAAGVSLVLSGSTIARTSSAGSVDDQLFLGSSLHASFLGVAGAPGKIAPQIGVLEGLTPWELSTADVAPYDVQLPDGVAPIGAAASAASYQGGDGAIVVHRVGPGRPCTVLLGFPLETIVPAERQAQIVARLVDYCPVAPPPGPIADAAPAPDIVAPDASIPDAARPVDAIADHGDQSAPASTGCGCEVARAPMAPLAASIVVLGAWLLALRRRLRR